MKKIALLLLFAASTLCTYAQNTLQVTDTGNLTRERWRDSLLRLDMQQLTSILQFNLIFFCTGICIVGMLL